MSRFLYSFNRQITTVEGRNYAQSALVVANDAKEADKILKSTLSVLRKNVAGGTTNLSDENASYDDRLPWRVDEIALDGPRLISMDISAWVPQ